MCQYCKLSPRHRLQVGIFSLEQSMVVKIALPDATFTTRVSVRDLTVIHSGIKSRRSTSHDNLKTTPKQKKLKTVLRNTS